MSFPSAHRGIFGAVASSLLLGACANISGLDGGSSYACKAPEGVKCDSVSGTYHNALQNNLPSQRRAPMGGQSQPPAAPSPAGVRTMPAILDTAARATPSDSTTGYVATPLRAAPRILRLWIKSWEDADRDLNGESLVYVQVDSGRWLVDHVQRQAREAFAPVRPGKSPAPSAKTADAAKPSAGADDASSITQALRALQSRAPAAADN